MIEIKELRKSFGTDEVLKGIDLSIAEKEVVVIIGPSGSGKSTLLRCMNHLEEHGIVPKTIVKPIVPLIEMTLVAAEDKSPYGKKDGKAKKKLGKKERENLVKSLLREMQQASRALEFERAAELRDMIVELEGELPKKKK